MVVLSFLILFMPALALPEEVISVNELYNQAVAQFCGLNFLVLKDSRGIVLRYFFDDINNLKDFYRFLKKIELFLAKIKNPAIIEVHIGRNFSMVGEKLKKWEVSTLKANEIEELLCVRGKGITRERIKSVGYGEFFPIKNTPNNGGNYINRIDIIILCNISGE